MFCQIILMKKQHDILHPNFDRQIVNMEQNKRTSQIASAYWGAKVTSGDKVDGLVMVTLQNEHGKDWKLILTQPERITDEDAIEVCKLEKSSYVSVVSGQNLVLNYLKILQISTIDYLRSKGYDLGYGNIPSLIDAGIAITNKNEAK